MKMEGDVLYAWLAGLIDGEGSIMLVKRAYAKKQQSNKKHAHYRAIVSICNTNYKLFDALTSNTGICRIYEHRVNGPADRPRARRMWTWRMVATDIRHWLPLIRPFLVLKGEQADLLLEATAIKLRVAPQAGVPNVRNDKIDRLDAIYAAIRKLNTRGRTLLND